MPVRNRMTTAVAVIDESPDTCRWINSWSVGDRIGSNGSRKFRKFRKSSQWIENQS